MGSQRVGRHRLGQPGLRYCRDHAEVDARLAQVQSRRTAARRPRLRTGYALGAVAATSAVVVSGWLAAGSAAFADIVSR